jgi:hypothetical protein
VRSTPETAVSDPSVPGRSCPLSYRTRAAAFAAGAATLQCDTLWIVGGLYGNVCALERVLNLYEAERGAKALVFNGDFHWFDVDAGDFAAIERGVSAHVATRGNVEAELARPAARAGCGCGYPDWVGDDTVERSNRIIERLRATAQADPEACRRLAALPMTALAEVGGERVGIVHGDADSLAGWGFSQEVLATHDGLRAAERAFEAAAVRVFASSHSCLPVMQGFSGSRALVNNGSAGMANFAQTRYGLATRISVAPSTGALYRLRAGALFVEAVAIDFDAHAWMRRFLAQWPAGSDAHASYFGRISQGPSYRITQALRPSAEDARVAA